MGRLPFDSSKMAAAKKAAAQGAATDAPPLSVSQLAARITQALHGSLPGRMRIVGQISGFRDRTHWYFDLKDEGAVISCVVFASSAKRMAIRPEDGLQVVLGGRVDFYVPGGKVSFVADAMEPLGAGPLEMAYRRLCEELRGLGWFAEERKRPLPVVPRRVAIVTSRTGAALQDVLDTARRRFSAAEVLLVDVRVQGAAAAPEIARAIAGVGRVSAGRGIDVLLLTRGGGSMEDLWAFNDRAVAEAVLRSPIPVVAAIGHETDTTIAELVADVRAATPTQAAMRIFPDGADLERQVQSLGRRLHLVLDRECRLFRERVKAAGRHPLLADPMELILRARERSETAGRTLTRVMQSEVAGMRSRLGNAGARLERVKPEGQISRRHARVDALAQRLALAEASRLKVDLRPMRKTLAKSLMARIASTQARLASTERQLAAVGPMGVLKRGFSVTVNARGEAIRSPSDVRPGEALTTRVAEGEFGVIVEGPGQPVRKPRPRRESPEPDTTGDSPRQMDLFGEASS